MALDIDNTTYHETGDRIWRIDSGTDYGEVWDMDIFEQHGEDYLDEDGYEGEDFGDDLVRDAEGDIEKLEVDFGDRGYKLFRDEETDDFWLIFYMEPDTDVESPDAYVDSVWEDEIETILSETARARMILRHELDNSDDKYRNRMAEKI